MRNSCCHVLFVAALLSVQVAGAEEVRQLTAKCEVALALSAAPKHLQDEAGVYVLREDGFKLVRKPKNEFSCLVERNHADSLIPQCFDSGSYDANLAVVLDEAKLLMDGMSFDELAERRRVALARGDYPSAGHGIVYMISDFNYIYSSEADQMTLVPPHVMFHAPNLTDRDVGGDRAAAMRNFGLPWINAQGPHGFMIVFVNEAAPSDDVEASCGGQLPERNSLGHLNEPSS